MTETPTQNDSSQKPAWSRFAVVAGVIILFFLGSYLLRDVPLEAGEDAPLWHLPQANGPEGTLSMESQRGKVVLLDFWSTSCPPCLMQIPVLMRIRNQFPEIQVIGVAVGGESLPQLKTFSAQRKVTYPIVSDLRGIAAKPYNVSSLPTLFIVGPDGVVIDSHIGFWSEDKLLTAVRKALNK